MSDKQKNKIVYINSMYIEELVDEIKNNLFYLDKGTDEMKIYFPMNGWGGEDRFIGTLYLGNGGSRLEIEKYDKLNNFFKNNINNIIGKIEEYNYEDKIKLDNKKS